MTFRCWPDVKLNTNKLIREHGELAYHRTILVSFVELGRLSIFKAHLANCRSAATAVITLIDQPTTQLYTQFFDILKEAWFDDGSIDLSKLKPLTHLTGLAKQLKLNKVRLISRYTITVVMLWFVCLLVVVLRHSDSISVISWW